MLAATLKTANGARPQVLCIGAHCDDIEIGMGATLLQFAQSARRPLIHWLILTSDPQRKAEAIRAMKAFLPATVRGNCVIGDLRDGYLPAHFTEVKDCFQRVRNVCAPDMVFTHCRTDLHQDHRLVGEITWQTFRDQLILEYEIPKYEGDLGTPNAYVHVSKAVAHRKARLLMKLYGTQRSKHWFSAETFLSLMKIRGIEARSKSGYAEGFHCAKMILDIGDPGR